MQIFGINIEILDIFDRFSKVDNNIIVPSRCTVYRDRAGSVLSSRVSDPWRSIGVVDITNLSVGQFVPGIAVVVA